jgi:hypothetical protein
MRNALLSSFAILTLAACAPQGGNNIAVGEPNPSAPDAGGIVMEQSTLDWQFTNVGTDDEPRTKVSLVIGGTNAKTIDMGTYAGNAVDKTNEQTEALLFASLWWAGGGDDVRVIGNGDGTLSLQHRVTDEVSGIGDWMTLQTIQE